MLNAPKSYKPSEHDHCMDCSLMFMYTCQWFFLFLFFLINNSNAKLDAVKQKMCAYFNMYKKTDMMIYYVAPADFFQGWKALTLSMEFLMHSQIALEICLLFRTRWGHWQIVLLSKTSTSNNSNNRLVCLVLSEILIPAEGFHKADPVTPIQWLTALTLCLDSTTLDPRYTSGSIAKKRFWLFGKLNVQQILKLSPEIHSIFQLNFYVKICSL